MEHADDSASQMGEIWEQISMLERKIDNIPEMIAALNKRLASITYAASIKDDTAKSADPRGVDTSLGRIIYNMNSKMDVILTDINELHESIKL